VFDIQQLPTLNATLNALSGVLLTTGYLMIRRRRIAAHRACMLAAFTASALFLTSYVIYHAKTGSRPFPGYGPIRVAYFTILISHIILAVTILPMAIVTLGRGLRAQYDRHVQIARWTFPIWMYVSVTGVVIYLMLYEWY
jgi:putative membrane protein